MTHALTISTRRIALVLALLLAIAALAAALAAPAAQACLGGGCGSYPQGPPTSHVNAPASSQFPHNPG